MAGIRNGSVLIARFVAPMSVISNRPVFATDTLSLKRKTGSQANIQRWEIQTQLEPLVGDPSLYIHMITNDSDTVIDVEMPQIYRASGVGGTTADSSLSLTVAGSIGDTLITVGNNVGKRVSSGEFIKFANHKKIYMVKGATLNGNGDLQIFPPLIANCPISTTVATGTSNVIMKARYDTSVVKGMIYKDGVLMDVGQVTLIEDL
jgi:hypothetical protein